MALWRSCGGHSSDPMVASPIATRQHNTHRSHKGSNRPTHGSSLRSQQHGPIAQRLRSPRPRLQSPITTAIAPLRAPPQSTLHTSPASWRSCRGHSSDHTHTHRGGADSAADQSNRLTSDCNGLVAVDTISAFTIPPTQVQMATVAVAWPQSTDCNRQRTFTDSTPNRGPTVDTVDTVNRLLSLGPSQATDCVSP